MLCSMEDGKVFFEKGNSHGVDWLHRYAKDEVGGALRGLFSIDRALSRWVLRMRGVVHGECSWCEFSCGCRAASVVRVVLD